MSAWRPIARWLLTGLLMTATFAVGAQSHRMNTAAAFIKANMPLGQGGTLSDQQSWDVAAYIDSRPRPPDPRRLVAR